MTEAQPAPAEPVTSGPPRPVRAALLTMHWLDLGLHGAWYGGGTAYLPNEHPRWQLYRADLLDLAGNLLEAAGLPAPAGPPVSVLYSPGVPARAGLPRPAGASGPGARPSGRGPTGIFRG